MVKRSSYSKGVVCRHDSANPTKLILTSIPIEGEDGRESFPAEVTTQTEKNLSLQNLDLI